MSKILCISVFNDSVITDGISSYKLKIDNKTTLQLFHQSINNVRLLLPVQFDTVLSGFNKRGPKGKTQKRLAAKQSKMVSFIK